MSEVIGFGRGYLANSSEVISFRGPGTHREFVIHYAMDGTPVITSDYLAYGHLLNEQLETTLFGRSIQRQLKER